MNPGVAVLIDEDSQLSHIRNLAVRHLDQDVLNFFFTLPDFAFSQISTEYKIQASILRAVTSRFEEYLNSARSNTDVEAVVNFTVRLLSYVEMPRKTPGSPEFREFLTATVQWYRALRRSIYVSLFWNNMYSILSLDLSALPDIRETIVAEIADIARSMPVPHQLEAILIDFSDRPYLFAEPRHYVRLLAYNLKKLILQADLYAIAGRWLFLWIRYIAIARMGNRQHHHEIIAMKDEIHRGIGYLMRTTAILRGRFGSPAISWNLFLIKLEHLIIYRHRLSHKPVGVAAFWLLRKFWRAAYIRRHVERGELPKGVGRLGARVKEERRPLEIIDQPTYRATSKAIIVTRVQGGLGDIMMMRPGLLELAARKPSVRIFFATNKSFFAAFSVDDPITLLDIENTRIDLNSFQRWHNFSYCPASRVETREFPKLKTNRIDIFARALGVKFPVLSRKRTRPFRFSDAHEARARALIAQHRRPGTLFIAVQYRSAETYRDAPAILEIARELAKVHTVIILDHRPVPQGPGDGYIPITSEPLQVAMALVAMADFMVGPDSSLFHVAGANRVPGITLFGPTGGKVRTKGYPTVKSLDMKDFMACVPCWRHEFSPCKVSGNYESICMKMLTAPVVLKQTDVLIRNIGRRNPMATMAPRSSGTPAPTPPALPDPAPEPAPEPEQPVFSAAEARGTAWLLTEAWPLWFERGIDWQRGGFFDKLDQGTGQNAADYKRLRVLARQIYVFSEAVAFGWADGRMAVDHGVAFLFERARRPDGGYAVRFDLAGNVIDDRRDLYDLAFTLFALARAFRVTGDAELQRAAHELVDYLDRTLRHPVAGFLEGIPAAGPRRQNPHMHLFEAAIACVENGWGEPFASLAHKLFDLFVNHFFQAERGVLPEYFDDALVPLTDESGRFIEPGHHHEWVWLLETWTRLTKVAPRQEASSLYDFADRYGANSITEPVRDEIWVDGTVKAATSRLWPQTERLKACLALFERTGDARYGTAAAGAADVLQRYLAAGQIPGLWREWLMADGTWSDEAAPASSLYHITLALAELRRARHVAGPVPPR
jgi:mannose-6-phosphate isomerase